MNLLKPREIEQYLVTKDLSQVIDEDQEEEMQKDKITTQMTGGLDSEKQMVIMNQLKK